MPEGNGIELAVAMARDQRYGPVLRTLGEGDHEMLAMPHGRDDGLGRPDAIVDVGGIEDETISALDQTQIGRQQEAQAFLNGCRSPYRLDEAHYCHRAAIRRSRAHPGRAADADGRQNSAYARCRR